MTIGSGIWKELKNMHAYRYTDRKIEKYSKISVSLMNMYVSYQKPLVLVEPVYIALESELMIV